MSVEYVALTIRTADPIKREVVNYHLENLGVSSIEEREQDELVYFETSAFETSKNEIIDLLSLHQIEYSEEIVVQKNWNAIWESSFQPVNINDFCYVRAPFHLPSEDRSLIDIILEPRMAFGTAHHATTYMMMQEMEDIDFQDKKVFDYGCGTAILAILAEKMGAKSLYAIDYDENAVENAIFNAEINNCEKIIVEQKVLSDLEPQTFDVILANINRQVLLDSALPLKLFLEDDGLLLLSGLLEQDIPLIKETYENAGWQLMKIVAREDWRCLSYIKKSTS